MCIRDRYILMQNERQEVELKIPLRGVGIANGWVDPINQLSENGLFAYALGLVDDIERQQVERLQIQGVMRIRNGDYIGARQNFDDLVTLIKQAGGGLNEYNYRRFGNYDYSTKLTSYLNQPTTQKLYDVDQTIKTVAACNPLVQEKLKADSMQSVANKLPYVLSKIPVLLYQSQDNLIVNNPSTQNWIQKLPWEKFQEFNDKDFEVWKLNDKVVGLTKAVDHLIFAIVNNAGQMVAIDAPEATYDLVKKFINKNL
eukprot:TRINITY_DN801_c0_g2_i7.p1 TRINITY_DN801_c0_g2~~TRINITY_DN801_c0_g2_i7.p1  ORF type:complete len:256 (-),score=54.80 TRINITY_DN801_c0_g2_i7:119-886(-)